MTSIPCFCTEASGMSCTRYWAPGVRVVWTPRGDWKDGARIRVTGGWGEAEEDGVNVARARGRVRSR